MSDHIALAIGYAGFAARWPVGTNLWGHTEAEAMVRYMLDGLPNAPTLTTTPKPLKGMGE